MKQQTSDLGGRASSASSGTGNVSARTFYRPDPNCSEFGSWYFLSEELGEVGPFDSREEAREALEMSQLLEKAPAKKSKKRKRAVH